MPSSLQAHTTRRAISPRLAMSIFLNMSSTSAGAIGEPALTGAARFLSRASWVHLAEELVRTNREQRLAVFDRLTVLHKHLDDLAGDIRLDLVHKLHGLDDAEHLPLRDNVPYFHEGR